MLKSTTFTTTRQFVFAPLEVLLPASTLLAPTAASKSCSQLATRPPALCSTSVRCYTFICLEGQNSMSMMDQLSAEQKEIFGSALATLLSSQGQSTEPRQLASWTQNGKKRRQEENGGGQTKGKGKGKGSATLEAKLNTLARVVMQHEDAINTAKLDRGLVFYMNNGEDSVLQTLFKVSQKAKEVQSQDAQQQQLNPLRILLLQALSMEIEGRIKLMETDPVIQEKTQSAQLVNEHGWTFKKWRPRLRQLVVDTKKKEIPVQVMRQHLSEMFQLMDADTVLKFGANRGMTAVLLEDPDKSTVFLLEVSLRGSNAARLFELFKDLDSSSIWQVVGAQMKRATLRRSGTAQKLGREVLGWN